MIWLVVLVGAAYWLGGGLDAYPALYRLVAGSLVLALGTLLVWVLLGFLPDWRSRRDQLNAAPLADEEWQARKT